MTALPAGAPVVVESMTLGVGDDPTLTIVGSGQAPATLELVGSRSRLAASVTRSGDQWSATIPLLTSRWGGEASAPPSGRYRFAPPLTVAGAVPEPRLIPRLFRIAFDAAESVIAVSFSAPLADDENGADQQARLETAYRSTDFPPPEAPTRPRISPSLISRSR